jgi:hypothetical protein
MSDRLSIPLVLRAPDATRLVFSFPAWYRALMGTILLVLIAGLIQEGARPGWPMWVLLAIVGFGVLYQEQWTFDTGRRRVVHKVGLPMAGRTLVIDFALIERFLIAPHVEGTIPGTKDERDENAAALRGGRGDDAGARRARHKKPYLGLIMACQDGANYLVDRVPARNVAGLRSTAARLAEFCDKPLVEFEL